MATPDIPVTTPEEQAPAEPTTETPGTQEQPQYVTREMLQEVLGSTVETIVHRVNQSSKDREQNIKSSVDAAVKRLEGLQIPVTPEIRTQLRAQVEQEMEATPSPTPQQPAPNLAQEVYQETEAIFTSESLRIEQSDPEWKKHIEPALKDPNGNMVKYRRAVYNALDRKRERLEGEKETAAARVGGGTGTASDPADISNITDTKTLIKMGEEQLRKKQRR